jgi:hypothetical protein
MAALGRKDGRLMPRPKSPDGRRNHVNIKLSDAEAEAVDAVRGALERGPWMREAALEAAHRALNAGIRERTDIGFTVDGRLPPGMVGVVSRGRDGVSVSAFRLGDTPEAAQDRQCEHRIRPGAYCKTCGRII